MFSSAGRRPNKRSVQVSVPRCCTGPACSTGQSSTACCPGGRRSGRRVSGLYITPGVSEEGGPTLELTGLLHPPSDPSNAPLIIMPLLCRNSRRDIFCVICSVRMSVWQLGLRFLLGDSTYPVPVPVILSPSKKDDRIPGWRAALRSSVPIPLTVNCLLFT